MWGDFTELIKKFGRKKDVDMTQGNIIRHLISFALPLFIGNIFQQLYNTVDTWVVGNYVSNEAFSAVGSVTPIINLLIGFFMGLSTGAGVVISQYYGARNYDRVRDTVHTSLTMTVILGMLFTAIGIAMVPMMLNLMNTPDEVVPEAVTYLTIYFAGVAGLMIYNIGSGILRAIGDSTRPFYFLVVSAVMNIVLDLVFVLVFKMGVAGVAYATIISQAVSALLVIIVLLRTDTCVKLELGKLKINWEMIQKILKIGIPAALQMAITSFSNVFVQSYMNHFGADAMGGWTAYSKIDHFLLLPMQSLSLAVTTFVGQNLGVNQSERARKGANTALLVALGISITISVPIVIFAPYLVTFFNDKPEVIEYGTTLIHCITPIHAVSCINQIYSGALRGAGNSRAPMIVMLLSFVLFRQCYLFVTANFICNEFIPISMGYPAGWMICSILMFIYYKRTNLSLSRVVEDK